MPEVLLFGGTTEGRILASQLCAAGCAVTACVATEYGEQLLEPTAGLRVLSGRRDQAAMEALLEERPFDCVVDATHPYALAVSENLRQACAGKGVPYLRLERPASRTIRQGQLREVASIAEAAQFLGTVEGNILLTTGSKELEPFTQVPQYAERCWVRVLPSVEAVEKCLRLGFLARHLVGMQGPFSADFNEALLRQGQICWLVTKDSGAAGGFPEKLEAAARTGTGVVVIGRRPQPQGLGWEALWQELSRRFGIQRPQEEPASEPGHFPLFVDLRGKTVQFAGGGTIALRRARSLQGTGCRIEVVAPEILPELEALLEPGAWQVRRWQPGDARGTLVLACTNDPQVNAAVGRECRAKGIPFNRCDRKEDCDFYFPAVLRQGPLVMGLCASGKDHARVRRAAARLRELDWETGKGEN